MFTISVKFISPFKKYERLNTITSKSTTLLRQHLLPAIRSLAGDFFVFQQDNAPAHRARETVALLKAATPDFISPQQWLPNSPDLNPVDYEIWGVLQQRVYHGQIRDVDHLKQRLIEDEEWRHFDQKIIDRAVYQWRSRLRMCPWKWRTFRTLYLNVRDRLIDRLNWYCIAVMYHIWVTSCKMWNINSTALNFKETLVFCSN